MARGFSSFHPLVCFLYYVGALALIMLGQHPAFLISVAFLLVILNFVQDKGRGLRQWWGSLALIALFFLIINPLLNHRGSHILFYFRDNPIMLEAVIKGIMIGLTLLCLFLIFLSYNYVITPSKFLFLFARVLPKWALLTMLTLRFVPLFRRRLADIDTVQRSKGLSVTTGKLGQRLKNGMLFLQILLTWSLEEAIQTADSMKARGYGLGKRTHYTPFKWDLGDSVALVVIVAFFCMSLIGWWLGDLTLQIQPVLESPLLNGREWIFYAIGLCYIGFPLAIEGREWTLWRF